MTDTLQDCRMTVWNQWLKRAEDLPCAAYAIKNDEGLTLLGGNQAFYRLIGCSEQTFRQRYGGRLSALIDAKPLENLPALQEGVTSEPIEVLQHLSRQGKDAWLKTALTVYPAGKDVVLCCTSVDVTDYEASAQSLVALRETVRIATEQIHVDCLEFNVQTGEAKVLSALSVFPDTLKANGGQCPDFVQWMLREDIVCPGYESMLQKAFQTASTVEISTTYELQLQHKERGAIWVKLSIAPQKCRTGVVTLWEDITQQKEAAWNYLNETQFYQAILSEKDAYGHVDVTENKITKVGGMWNLYNEIIDQVTYSKLIEEFIYKVVHPEDRKHYLEVMQRDNFIQSFDNGIDQLGCEFRRIVEQNKMVWMQLSTYLFRDPRTNHIIGVLTIQNINDRKQQEMLLLRDSSIDKLTHVYNRRMAEAIIQERLSQMTPEDEYGFVVLDVDDFKQINDVRGHHMGDQALVRLSDYLNRFFSRGDIVGRFGGDEFIIFLPNITNRASIEARMEELFVQIQTRWVDDADQIPISCSAGIVLCQGKTTYEQIFLKADQALYLAKNAGKGQFAFYREGDPLMQGRGKTFPHKYSSSDEEASAELMRQVSDEELLQVFAPAPSDSSTDNSFDNLIGAQGDIAYLIQPSNFDLICGNQAFYDRLGLSATQCEGKKCYELMHKRDTPCPFCSRANWSTDKFYLWRNLNTSLEQEFLIKNKLVTWQEKEVLLAIAIDISNNKSIVDSMDNSLMETHNLLSGVQHMTQAQSLTACVKSALETIGCFFHADTVCFWQYDEAHQYYYRSHSWCRTGQKKELQTNEPMVHQWLNDFSWDQSLMLESPEAMLGHSYDMYLYMKEHCIQNQRWMRIEESGALSGFISIDNSSSNLQNVAFLESFSIFIASELKKRNLIEDAIYAGRHDELTDLLSRKSFESFVQDYSADQVTCIGVLVANFNNLKGINSSSGFQTGNYLICQFADMLKECLDGPYIYRLNGDEFLVILPDRSRSYLEERIAALEQMVRDNAKFTVSIGYSWDDVENDLAAIIEQATQTMKLHKKRHYDVIPNAVDVGRRSMINELVACIENREFEVFFQPKVELQHDTVVGAEALIRYHHEELGYIGPVHFIELLEKNNVIRYIDLFVFEEVCRQLERWKKQGIALPVVSLNFSRLTLLEQDILDYMEEIISRYDVPKKYVEIEITESVSNMGKSILYQNAQSIYKAGFPISLDDFGTNYTNLSILTDLDFSILKVDKSLVGELSEHSRHRLVMKNIISMCQDLGIQVLAEGIETALQASILKELNCNLGQGYLYGKPMPIEEFDQTYIQCSVPRQL